MASEELQEEVYEWSVENFGEEQPASFPLAGMGEEAGELMCSVLKRAQGIDDDEKYEERDDVGEEAERDAVGDIQIYRADGLKRLMEEDDHLITDEMEHLFDFYYYYGKALRTFKNGADDSRTERWLGVAENCLKTFCEERGFDMEGCVSDAWEEVSGREWNADVDVREDNSEDAHSFHPSDLTVAQIRDELEDVTNLSTAEAIRDLEKENKDRDTAVGAIESHIAKMDPGNE